MFYLTDQASCRLHGPFLSRFNANTYAEDMEIQGFIITDKSAQQMIDTPLRLVPVQFR